MRLPEWLSRRGKADSLDRAVEAYEAGLGAGGPPLARYWDELGPDKTASVLAALVKVDLHHRFESGERPRVLEYLDAFPVLAEVDDRVVSLVYEEFCLLEEGGERPDSLAFCEAYGPWRDSLRSQLEYHRELSRAVGAEDPRVVFPNPGDRFDKYRLTSLLGVGGVARVYLATDEDLGDRQVALKVSASFGQEPEILARLDHRNIVPIWNVARSDTGLRGICMPYRPGATLEELIRRIGRGTPPRAARAISEALRPPDPSAGFPPEERRDGWEDFPIDRTFPEAVAWIGLALANALSYLHERGVFHRDIKPANILLADREGPQLLDFNLAQVPSDAEGASAAQRGGTLPYMAPEQLRAFLDSSAWDDVGSAADLYSLGLVLRELLTGQPPPLPTSRGSLTREIQSLIDRRLEPPGSIGEINPAVPPALESIIGKCLAFRPEDRYADADELAGDLRRFLDRKPLLVAPNTSRLELAVNWACRNRYALISTILFLAVLASLDRVRPRAEPPEARFEKAEQHLDSGRPGDLNRSRAEFETLHREYSATARSSLGLALVLRKLGDPSETKHINELLKEAAGKDDAQEVFRARLLKEPRSELLHLTLGVVLTEAGRYDLARESLEQALKIDPGGFSAHQQMARLDDLTDHPQDALGHLSKAIEAGAAKVEASKIYHLRKAGLHILVDMIDRDLEPGKGPDGRAEAASYHRRLESELQSLSQDREKIPDGAEKDDYAYTTAFFEGCLASSQGVLKSEGAGPGEPNRAFDDAGRHFERARELASRQGVAIDRVLPIRAQEEKLAKRRDAR